MAGKPGRSGRRPKIVTPHQAQGRLLELTKKAVKVMEDRLDQGDIACAWNVVWMTMGRPKPMTQPPAEALAPAQTVNIMIQTPEGYQESLAEYVGSFRPGHKRDRERVIEGQVVDNGHSDLGDWRTEAEGGEGEANGLGSGPSREMNHRAWHES